MNTIFQREGGGGDGLERNVENRVNLLGVMWHFFFFVRKMGGRRGCDGICIIFIMKRGEGERGTKVYFY